MVLHTHRWEGTDGHTAVRCGRAVPRRHTRTPASLAVHRMNCAQCRCLYTNNTSITKHKDKTSINTEYCTETTQQSTRSTAHKQHIDQHGVLHTNNTSINTEYCTQTTHQSTRSTAHKQHIDKHGVLHTNNTSINIEYCTQTTHQH